MEKTGQKNKFKFKVKHIILAAALIAVIFFVFFRGSKSDIDVSRLKFAEVVKGDMLYSITATGTIEPLRKVEIKSIASGKIIRMHVDTGSYVRMRGLICQIDPTEEYNNYNKAKVALKVAKLTLEKAKADLNRQNELFKNKYIASATLEDYKLKLAKAKLEYVKNQVDHDNALKKYREAWVRAPINGTILEKFVEKGQIISSGTYSASGGTKIAIIANLSHVYIKAMVDETDISQVKTGQKAKITIDAYSDKKFTGSVYKIEPIATVEQNVTSFLVTVRIHNPKKILKPGLNASVVIQTEKLKDLLLIPYSAVKKIGKRRFVFIQRKGKLQPKYVKLGKTNFTVIEVKRGLREKMKIVVSGLTKKMVEEIMKNARKGRSGRRKGRKSRRLQRMMRKRR